MHHSRAGWPRRSRPLVVDVLVQYELRQGLAGQEPLADDQIRWDVLATQNFFGDHRAHGQPEIQVPAQRGPTRAHSRVVDRLEPPLRRNGCLPEIEGAASTQGAMLLRLNAFGGYVEDVQCTRHTGVPAAMMSVFAGLPL
jgi:hypothetical protein